MTKTAAKVQQLDVSHVCGSLVVWEGIVVNPILVFIYIFQRFHLRPVSALLDFCFLVPLATKNTPGINVKLVRHVTHTQVQSSAHRFLWIPEDTSSTTVPAPSAPMTTPNTMSHCGVSWLTGAAKVGGIPMNSRVLSVSRKALLMRFLDFLLDRNTLFYFFLLQHVCSKCLFLLPGDLNV